MVRYLLSLVLMLGFAGSPAFAEHCPMEKAEKVFSDTQHFHNDCGSSADEHVCGCHGHQAGILSPVVLSLPSLLSGSIPVPAIALVISHHTYPLLEPPSHA